MKKPKVELRIVNNYVKLYINGLLHVQFRCDQIIGIQSTIEGTNWYSINYYLKDGHIKSEYYSQQLWTDILKELDKTKL